MSSLSTSLRSQDKRWRYEDDIQFIKSLVGSELEFVERVSKRQRVVGTLHKCEGTTFHLIGAIINGKEFGDYNISEWEIHKWRIISYKRRDNPSKSRLPNRYSFCLHFIIISIVLLSLRLKTKQQKI